MKTLELEVVALVPEAKDTVTILLRLADGSPLDYQAGQFLTFLFSFHGHALRRSYSFSSTPGLDPIASITVKRVVNGEISRFLLDHLQPGDRLMSLLPAGKFTLSTNEPAPSTSPVERPGPVPIFFIAAGSGMVPVFSLIKEALATRPDTPVVLLSQHHDEDSILFKASLTAMVEQHNGRFQWISFLSTPSSSPRHQAGRLNNWLLESLLRDWSRHASSPDHLLSQALFYCCGPEAFMRMISFTLRLMGVAGTQIKKEHFTVEYVPPPPLLSDTHPRTVHILMGDTAHTFQVAWPTTILQAALDNHIPLPYSCKGGRCSSCVAKCTQGKVVMSINEVLTENDLKAGLVLTCVGYAATDVTLAY